MIVLTMIIIPMNIKDDEGDYDDVDGGDYNNNNRIIITVSGRLTLAWIH